MGDRILPNWVEGGGMVGKQSNPLEYSGKNNKSQRIDIPSLPADSANPESVEFVQPFSLAAPKPKSWKVWLAALGFCCVLGGVGTAAFWWLTTPPPSPDCQKLSPLATDMERLLCAQESARSGDLPKVLAGLELVAQWTPDHPLYREAQRLVAEWSDPVLAGAQQRIDRSDLRGAIELANRIPKTSPVYKEAQAHIAEWKRYWQKGEAISTAARKAMQAQNWLLASEKIDDLKAFDQDYWRYERVLALSNLLTAERQGRQFLAQAQALSKNGQLDQLGSAIAVLSRIDSRTYAWADAQKPMQQWSEVLLAQGWQNWQKGNLTNAMSFALPVLKNPALAETAQELLWLSQARNHAIASTTTLKPTLPQLWNLSAAISTAQFIPEGSRYYTQAQSLLKNWQTQFQDLTLLQFAWSVGDVAHPWAKQLAIWQASQVTPTRSRRAQAQTLVSFWQAGIRRLEDQPYIAYARQLATKGTIPALQQAIAQAQLISPNRPTRKDAQTLVASWTQQIQAIEDRPILDRAFALANQGNLALAIQVASTIAPQRSLYGEAQSAIWGWQASIRAAELARIREREEALHRSRSPQEQDPNFENQPFPEPDTPVSSDSFPTPETPYPNPPSLCAAGAGGPAGGGGRAGAG
ncbi:MAG: hypothetical protein NW224_11300, partial [Leptolyngbyaceae cyanobacterium bins.302]|nr:hypothetical protein [Leptolyngbyaceae cyanobacterium bins.302]